MKKPKRSWFEWDWKWLVCVGLILGMAGCDLVPRLKYKEGQKFCFFAENQMIEVPYENIKYWPNSHTDRWEIVDGSGNYIYFNGVVVAKECPKQVGD